MRVAISLFRAALALAVALVLALAGSVFAAEEAAKPGEARVVIATGDSLRGSGLVVTAKAVVIETPYSGKVEIDRRVVAGIVFGAGRDDDFQSEPSEQDVVHLKGGDKVSGDIVQTADGALVIKAFYAGGKESRITLDTIDFVAFTKAGQDEQTELQAGPVRVILANGDVVGGTLAGFKNGAFRLETPYAGVLTFRLADIQSLHNAEKSRQFYPGGPADVFVSLLERSGWLDRDPGRLFLSLIRGLLNWGDPDGALKLLQHMERYEIEPWTYQEVARAFEQAKLTDAALVCYERMYPSRNRNPYVYRQLYEAYLKNGHYVKAAGILEEVLTEKPGGQLAGYGLGEAQVRLALADVYNRTEEYDKAIDHLRRVLGSPSADQAAHGKARALLVSTFEKVGRLDELIATYLGEAGELDAQLGQDYLTLVTRYVERGKFAKARAQLERLRRLGLDEWTAKAQAVVDAAKGGSVDAAQGGAAENGPPDETEDEDVNNENEE